MTFQAKMLLQPYYDCTVYNGKAVKKVGNQTRQHPDGSLSMCGVVFPNRATRCLHVYVIDSRLTSALEKRHPRQASLIGLRLMGRWIAYIYMCINNLLSSSGALTVFLAVFEQHPRVSARQALCLIVQMNLVTIGDCSAPRGPLPKLLGCYTGSLFVAGSS